MGVLTFMPLANILTMQQQQLAHQDELIKNTHPLLGKIFGLRLVILVCNFLG